jgi:hypothetical protein
MFLKRATDFSDTFSKEYSWRTEIQRVRDRKREGEIERVTD